ncbi:DUSAM domain-containing protein [Myxococcus vastator]|uniref:DUSAM domain-containing protein n=1 Tax=Myxococcus vastator TaxID=2709664 RepID=UPI003084671C
MGPRVPAWEHVIAMERRTSPEGGLALPGEDRAQVQDVALEVMIAEAEVYTSLRTPEGLASLLREIRRRVREAGKRYSSTFNDVHDLQEAGDAAGARKVLEEYIASEAIPRYRELAVTELEHLE